MPLSPLQESKSALLISCRHRCTEDIWRYLLRCLRYESKSALFVSCRYRCTSRELDGVRVVLSLSLLNSHDSLDSSSVLAISPPAEESSARLHSPFKSRRCQSGPHCNNTLSPGPVQLWLACLKQKLVLRQPAHPSR